VSTPIQINTSGGLFSAAYLVSAGKTADEAWEMIREKRPFVRPGPEQVAQVERFAAEIED